jgi:hypothetical protein
VLRESLHQRQRTLRGLLSRRHEIATAASRSTAEQPLSCCRSRPRRASDAFARRSTITAG